jgi:hypothetical protein
VRPRFACIAASIGLVTAAGCAQPGYNARKLESQLVDAGATREQAHCVTRALENTFDQSQMGSRTDPTAKEEATTRALLERCDIALKPQL